MRSKQIMWCCFCLVIEMTHGRCAYAEYSPLANDGAQESAISIREGMNPFKDSQIKCVRIHLAKADTVLSFKINDLAVTTQELDSMLEKLAAIDSDQVIIVEADESINDEDLIEAINMLKKHGLINAVKRGADDDVIWLIEENE